MSSKTWIKPRKFDGTGCFETFLAQFMNASRYNHWNDDDNLAQMCSCLSDKAATVLWDLPAGNVDSFEKLKQVLATRFGNKNQQERYRIELRSRRQKPNETIQCLSMDIQRLASLAYMHPFNETTEIIMMDAFIDALSNRDIARKIMEREPRSVDEATKIALRLEALASMENVAAGTSVNIQNQPRQQEPNAEMLNQITELRQELNAVKNSKFISNANNHTQSRYDRNNRRFTSSSNIPWTHERSTNHTSGDYGPSDTNVEIQTSSLAIVQPINNGVPSVDVLQTAGAQNKQIFMPATESTSKVHSKPDIICYNCSQPGHISRNCVAPRRPRNSTTSVNRINGLSSGSNAAKVYAKMTIGKVTTDVLFDSGCELSIVPFRMVKHITLNRATHTVTAANGTPVNIIGEKLIRFKLNGIPSSAEMLVSDEIDEPMLGSDYLHKECCVWDWSKSVLHIKGQDIQLHSRKPSTNCRRVMVSECVVLPPLSETNVSLKMPHKNIRDADSMWLIDTSQIKPGVHLARTVVPASTCNVLARVCNINEHPQIIKQETMVGKAVPVEVIHSCQGDETQHTLVEKSETIDGIIDEIVGGLPESVGHHYKQQMSVLLHKHKDIISTGEFDIGYTDILKHKIDTGNHAPIREPLRRHPLPYLKAIDSEVEKMLEHKIISPSTSEWCSNVCLVKKADGTLHFAIDYRKLNSISKHDSFFCLKLTDVWIH